MFSVTRKQSLVLFLLCFCSLILEIKAQTTPDPIVGTSWTDTPLATSESAANESISQTITDIPSFTMAPAATTPTTTSRTTITSRTTSSTSRTTPRTSTTTTTRPNKGNQLGRTINGVLLLLCLIMVY